MGIKPNGGGSAQNKNASTWNANHLGVTGIPNLILFNLVNVEGLGDEFQAKSRCFDNLSSDSPTVSNCLPRCSVLRARTPKGIIATDALRTTQKLLDEPWGVRNRQKSAFQARRWSPA